MISVFAAVLLRHVQHIQATRNAFAAVAADGVVATWGSSTCGGDSSAVCEQLTDTHLLAEKSACVSLCVFVCVRACSGGD